MPTEYMHLVFARQRAWRLTHESEVFEVLRNDPRGNLDEPRQNASFSAAWARLTTAQRELFSNNDQVFRRAKWQEWRGWVCSAYPPSGEHERWDLTIDEWHHGVPLTAITQALNRLGADGWTIVSASEDKGLYLGTDSLDESYPTRVRYLLMREPTSGSSPEGD